MSNDRLRLFAWALSVQDLGVTALVAWALAVFVMAEGVTEERHYAQPPPGGTFAKDLGFVGVPTVMAQPIDRYPIVASGAIGRPSRS